MSEAESNMDPPTTRQLIVATAVTAIAAALWVASVITVIVDAAVDLPDPAVAAVSVAAATTTVVGLMLLIDHRRRVVEAARHDLVMEQCTDLLAAVSDAVRGDATAVVRDLTQRIAAGPGINGSTGRSARPTLTDS